MQLAARYFPALLVAAVLLVACGGSQPAASPEAAPRAPTAVREAAPPPAPATAQPSVQTVQVGVLQIVSDAGLFIAAARGYFQEAGLAPEFSARDGSWGERYFHIVDPDGHELSFARPI
jgi:ABC-type nitrate/sulfonate/bicarbonate transport system substrate-binding protein